jgi:SAM-dependent methyltransferase
MNYDNDTRNAYRNELKAKDYQEQYTKGAKWARFTMWRQRALIEKIIKQCNFQQNDKILDIPCGTGFIGKILCNSPGSVIASDISIEMMRRAFGEYRGNNFHGFIQCDITQTPFRRESFDCVILLAFMHRLPKETRYKTWEEAVSISKKFIIVNYSLDNRLQRLKQWLIKKVHSNHIPAPSSLPLQVIRSEIGSYGLTIRKISSVMPLFSAKIIFLLEKI